MPRVINHAIRPTSTPNTTNQKPAPAGTPGPSTSAIEGTLNEGKTPKNEWPMYVAVTQASATQSKLSELTHGSINSIANAIPPIGVLNVAAIPAPAPVAIRIARCRAGIAMTCPTDDPKAEPIWIIGPSRPTEPPLPMDMAEATDLIAATMGRI